VRLLRGFNWREDERPKSVEDLFNEDAPLELPIIKGLDDYIPQEEFFDDSMLKRIENADKDARKRDANKKATSPAKASRSLPKNLNKPLINSNVLKKSPKAKSN
jgi:hypothetical protein